MGRKVMLMITMAIMALGTFAVGLLPTYQQIGVWAPILLVTLRFIQGIALGGEWGGAVRASCRIPIFRAFLLVTRTARPMDDADGCWVC
jgi:MFS family permease